MKRLLIAGIGNVFKGDDAFGVEVVKRLADRGFAPQVDVVDFGINGIDLVYALLDRYDAALLFDTFHGDGAPGSLYVIEPESCEDDDAAEPDGMMLSPHEMDPAKVLRTVRAMDGRCRRIVLVGCEPEDFGDEWEGRMELTDVVKHAVDLAAGMADGLVEKLLAQIQIGREKPGGVCFRRRSVGPANADITIARTRGGMT